MPIKINELVIQVKVYDADKQVAHDASGLSLEHQKLALVKEVLTLLGDCEAR